MKHRIQQLGTSGCFRIQYFYGFKWFPFLGSWLNCEDHGYRDIESAREKMKEIKKEEENSSLGWRTVYLKSMDSE